VSQVATVSVSAIKKYISKTERRTVMKSQAHSFCLLTVCLLNECTACVLCFIRFWKRSVSRYLLSN